MNPATGALYATGTDKNIWTRATLTSPWTHVADTCCFLGAVVMPNGPMVGTMVAVGDDNLLWSRKNSSGPWSPFFPAGSPLTSISVTADGTLIATGRDNYVYSKKPDRIGMPTTGWIQAPNSCCLVSACVQGRRDVGGADGLAVREFEALAKGRATR